MSNNDFASSGTRAAIVVVLGLLLCACGPKLEKGTTAPPPQFGELAGTGKACSTLAGRFVWEADPKQRVDRRFRNLPGPGRDVAVYPGTELSISRGAGGTLVLRTRAIDPDPGLRNSDRWNMVTYNASQLECIGGMVVFAPKPVLDSDDIKNFGGQGLLRGFRLGLLQDGALAWGLENVSTGHHGSLYTWGGVSAGTYKAADTVYWSWARLPRIGEADSGR